MTTPIRPTQQTPPPPPPPPPPKPKKEAPTGKSATTPTLAGDSASAMKTGTSSSKLSLQPPTPAPVVVPSWTPPDEAPAATLYRELGKAAEGPGEMFNMMSKKHLEDVRRDYEEEPPAKGVLYDMEDSGDGPRAKVKGFEDIPAPGGGQWDPKQFAPHYVFDPQEDAFPVRPDYDGNGDTSDNGGSTLEDTGSDHYRDGVIDGQQNLNAGFVVQQKGEYTVLTYSNYYATNKGAHYHKNDYSTAQVYLKPNAKGEMEPQFLATSWHYGTVLTPWKDVQKDATGHPVIGVGLGTHSLQPYGHDMPVPQDGLHIHGDGTSTLDGKPTGHAMTYDAFQSNVKNATVLTDLDSDRATTRMTTLGYGWAAADPLHPSTFNNDNTQEQVEDRIEDDLEAVEEHGGEFEEESKQAILENAEKVAQDDQDVPEKSTWDKIKDIFS